MVQPTALTELASALTMGPHEHVSVVGGGGKTTTVHALGAQLNGRRVLTCTTKMGHDQHLGRRVLLSPGDDEVLDASADGPVVVWRAIDGQKALGVPPEWCDHWFELVDHVLIEADGSRRRPFKAPAEYEPVVPATTTLMVSVIGADALGRVIADQCHRPLRVAALAQCTPYERLSPEAAATVLLHERGARKELPVGARLAVVITKLAPVNHALVEELAGALTDREPDVPVIVVPLFPDPNHEAT
jgi:molybdenum cofactor cytidylyltransferase